MDRETGDVHRIGVGSCVVRLIDFGTYDALQIDPDTGIVCQFGLGSVDVAQIDFQISPFLRFLLLFRLYSLPLDMNLIQTISSIFLRCRICRMCRIFLDSFAILKILCILML
jgi:hypothetical protein